jgi:Phycobilisome degradation protein nblA
MSFQTPESNQPQSTNLSLEQQFSVVNFQKIAEGASKEQLVLLYAELLRHLFTQKNYYERLLKAQWGINEPDIRPTEEERPSQNS